MKKVSSIKYIAKQTMGMVTILSVMVLIIIITQQSAFAGARINSWVGNGEADFASALYRKEFIDMQVKVRGRMLNIKRRWQDDHWTLLPDIGDLKFEYEQIYVENNSSGFVATRAGNSTGASSSVQGVLPETVDGELIYVKRGDFKYIKVEGGTEDETIFIFTEDGSGNHRNETYTNRKTITKNSQGYIWSDGLGEKIVYDSQGRTKYLEDRNGNRITIVRDANDRISIIKDPVGHEVISISYSQNDASKITRITDYTGRYVEYIWSDDILMQFIDVMGESTSYDYEYFKAISASALIKEKNPLGHTTIINYYASDGGTACAEKIKIIDPEKRKEDELNQGFKVSSEYNPGLSPYTGSSLGCKVWISHPPFVIYSGLTYDGEGKQNVNYSYFRNEKNEQYSRTRQQIDGLSVEKVFNSNGSLIAEYINAVKLMKLSYNGNKTIIENNQGYKVTKEYNEWKELIKVTYPDLTSTSRTYNSFGQVSSYTNELGVVTRFNHDSKGNLEKVIYAENTEDQQVVEICNQFSVTENCNALKLEHCMAAPTDYCGVVKVHGGIVGEHITEDSVTVTIFDDYGNAIKTKDPEGNIVELKDFDAIGNSKTAIDAKLNPWLFTYDNAGNTLSSTSPLGKLMEYTYDKIGNLETVTDPMPNQGEKAYDRKYIYNKYSHGVKTEDSYGNLTTIDENYGLGGGITKFTDADQKSGKVEYDFLGRLLWVENGNGEKIKFNYAVDGTAPLKHAASIEYPTFTRHFKYDIRNRPVKIFDEIDGGTELVADIEYNALGLTEKVTDQEGLTVEYEYNKLGVVTKQISSGENETSYVYDKRGNLISITDAEGKETKYRYNKNNQQVKEIRPMGEEYQFFYDERGMVDYTIDAKGNKVDFEYDADGQLEVQRTYAPGSDTPEKTTNYTYYQDGMLKSYSDGTTTGTYTYNDAGLLLSGTIDYGTFSKTYSYSYTNNRTLQTYTDAENITYSYEYNSNNQLSRVAIPGQGSISFSEYDWVVPTKVVLPGGTTHQFGFDERLRPGSLLVTDPAGKELMRQQYERSPAGTLKEKITEHGTYAYEYDNQYRLTEAALPGDRSESYTYDKVGNRLSSSYKAGDWIYNSNHELTNTPDANFVYDDNGSMTKVTEQGQDTHYIYNAGGRLAEVKDNNNQTIAKYEYDPYGRRISKEVSGVKTYFLYTPLGLVGEYDAAGNLIRGYGYLPGGSWSTDPVYQKTADGKFYYYLNDLNGTPNKLVAGNGKVVWDATYDSFGNIQIATNIISNPVRLAGQYEDEETGLYYNLQRYYDPKLGRYITSDSLGLIAGVNTYNYVNSNPIMFFDPRGEILNLASGVVGGIIGGAIGGGIALFTGGDVGEAMLEGAIAGGVAGLTFGLAGPALAGYGIAGSAAAGALGGMAGDAALQAYRMAMGKQCEFDWGQMFGAGIAGGVFGAAFHSLGRLWAGARGAMSRSPKMPAGPKAPSGPKAPGGPKPKPNQNPCMLCFVEGTYVATEDGDVPIEDIEVGDMVYAKNIYTGEVALKEVLQLVRPKDRELVDIDFVSQEGQIETITATPDHPFWVEGKEWVAAEELASEDEVLTLDGNKAQVYKVTALSDREDVYNFEVEDFHTYYVGKTKILVHNCPHGKNMGQSSPKIGKKPKFDWKHILDRHHPSGKVAQQRMSAGGSQAEGVFQGVSKSGVKGIVKNAWKSRKLVETQIATDGSKTQIFVGVDSVSGQSVKFWQHADGRTLAGRVIGQ